MADRGIVDQIDGLKRGVENIEVLRKLATDSTAINTRTEQLEALAIRLRGQVVRLQLYEDRGFHPFVDLNMSERLLETTRSHREAFEADHSSIAADPQDSRFKWRYHDDAIRLCRSIEFELRELWLRHVDRLSPAGVEELVDVFERIPEFSDDVEEISRVRAELTDMRSEAPESAADFERAEKTAQRLKDRLQTLRGVPKNVTEFLATASTEGAHLDSLTEDVRSWLERNDFLGSLRYIFKRGL